MLFNHSIALVQNGVTSIPTRMARFDDTTQQWTQLPENVEVQSLWFADDSPTLRDTLLASAPLALRERGLALICYR
jgi:hypothetical protein